MLSEQLSLLELKTSEKTGLICIPKFSPRLVFIRRIVTNESLLFIDS
ncbi:unnamed protein product [Schistosoma margrebowiei]|uniref:Uncharacterized protein n=1 Tax=Schistosoma margrebowiei TaxID=48269 RepID=A0A3P8DE97_9TREM|nr:unnamed protein product [Schistosoma margrebowiei]